MSDISKCKNEECIMKQLCWRFTSPPSLVWQSYADFIPENNTKKKFKCNGLYIKNNGKEI